VRVLAGIKKFSPNNENISFFVPVLEKIIVILPTGEKPIGFCLGCLLVHLIRILLIVNILNIKPSSKFEVFGGDWMGDLRG
jgi:hypothetical protein